MALAKRELGKTEQNWCLGLDGGTGVSVSAFFFGIPLSKSTVQAAMNKMLCELPFLSSHIVSENKKLFFKVGQNHALVEEFANPFGGAREGSQNKDLPAEIWLKIVDLEMNIMFPTTRPTPILQVHLYNNVPDDSSLVVLRAHSAAADMLSTGAIGSTFLNSLKDVVEKAKAGQSIEELLKVKLDKKTLEDFEFYPAVENAIPKGAKHKPFWAHGTDVIGYGLVSRKHSYLPFRDTKKPRQSRLIRASFSKEATDRLLKASKDNSSDLYGVLSAAALKSAATFKKTGNKGEHYGVAVLYNCRAVLDPKLDEDTIGFYQSALLKTTQTGENHQFWKVAAHCTQDFQDAIKNRKHFTDMGDLNMLMVQAINHPNLTPSCTLRTAMYLLPYDSIMETTPLKAAEVLQLKDFVSTSSIQGVGPCLAIFHALRDGALHVSFVYCEPLFSRQDIQTLVDSMVGYLTV